MWFYWFENIAGTAALTLFLPVCSVYLLTFSYERVTKSYYCAPRLCSSSTVSSPPPDPSKYIYPFLF